MLGLVRKIIDYIFITIFVMFLFVPMMDISNAEISTKENRTLAKLPNLFIGEVFNSKFIAEFENYFNDRFNGRNLLLKIAGYLHTFSSIIQNDVAVYFKKYDVMFNKAHMSPFIYSDNVLQQTVIGIKSFYEFCKDNKMKCYIEVVPEKILFYEGKIFDRYKREMGSFSVLREQIKNELNLEIVYPFDELYKANEKDYIYFKTDHHWTDWGAYIGYLSLMNKIKQDIPELKILSLNDFIKSSSKKVRAEHERIFTEGCTCQVLNMPESECPLNLNYQYYDFNRADYHVEFFENKRKNSEYAQAQNIQKVMLIGNSFVENFMVFLGASFQEVRKRRANVSEETSLRLTRWMQEIQEYKPEILVILVGEHFAKNHLRDLYVE